MYPPNLNVPLPDPSQLAPDLTKPDKMQQALSLMIPLFSLGAALGGSPTAGASFMHGANQTMERHRQEQAVKAHQQQLLQQRQQEAVALEQHRQQQEEVQRQQAIQKVIMDTAVQARGAKTREEYESIITANEAMAGQFYGLRPNTIRAVVPYHAPSANQKMAEAGTAFLKNPANAQAIEDGKLDGSIMVDVQDDGKPLAVPLKDVLSVTPGVQLDPETHVPIFTPKEKKQTDIKLDDEQFLGEVAKFEAEKGRKATQQERGDIARKIRMTKPPSVTAGQSGSGDAESIAEAIIKGEQPPDLKGLYRMGPAVRASLAKQGYNLANAQLDWQATQKHIATLNSQQQTRMRQAVDNASHSLDTIETLADQWKGGKFPILNRGRLAAAKGGALGPQAQQIATALEAQIADVTAELANVYMGGNSPTDRAMQLAAHNLSADWTESTLRKLIEQQRQNLQIRSNSMSNVGAQGTSDTNPYGPKTTPADAGAEVWVYGPNGKLVKKGGG
jgi:hypothetical protein